MGILGITKPLTKYTHVFAQASIQQSLRYDLKVVCIALISLIGLGLSLASQALTLTYNAPLRCRMKFRAFAHPLVPLHQLLKMSNTERPACLPIHQLSHELGDGYYPASLMESARCGCHHCACVYNGRPNHNHADEVGVTMSKTTLRISYHITSITGPACSVKEFFVSSSKSNRLV